MPKLNLQKQTENLKLSLKKKNVVIGDTKLRVGMALDISGSMQQNYRNGEVSEFVGKLLPFGCIFDDNSEIDTWAFNSYSQELPPATPNNYSDYVHFAMKDVDINGGTSYAPVIGDILEFYFGYSEKEFVSYEKASGLLGLFGKKHKVVSKQVEAITKSNLPAIVFFVTDGECSDYQQTERMLAENESQPVYWVGVGIGNSRFTSLENFKNKFDNFDLITVESLSLDDEDLYDKILSGGLKDFIEKHKA